MVRDRIESGNGVGAVVRRQPVCLPRRVHADSRCWFAIRVFEPYDGSARPRSLSGRTLRMKHS
jgi:hypothetical protein